MEYLSCLFTAPNVIAWSNAVFPRS